MIFLTDALAMDEVSGWVSTCSSATDGIVLFVFVALLASVQEFYGLAVLVLLLISIKDESGGFKVSKSGQVGLPCCIP